MSDLVHRLYGRALASPLRPLFETAFVQALRDRLVPFKVLPNGVAEVRVEGLVLRLPRPFAWRYVDGFEPLSMAWLKARLRPAITVADIGAHVGFVALIASRGVGEGGAVHCFEPVENNLRYLSHNVFVNRATNIEIHPVAVGREDGLRRFFLTDASDSQGFYPHPWHEQSGVIEVRQVTLDGQIGRLDLAKVDVEGAELDVLAGMTRLLEDHPPMLVEWAPACQLAAGHQPDELVEVLKALGYTLRVLDDFVGCERSPQDALALVHRGDLPQHWYANLACEPS